MEKLLVILTPQILFCKKRKCRQQFSHCVKKQPIQSHRIELVKKQLAVQQTQLARLEKDQQRYKNLWKQMPQHKNK
jgi:hypothetical protein